MEGVPLQLVEKYTYLGVILDRTLSMEPHARDVLKKLNFLCYNLCKLRYKIPADVAISIFKHQLPDNNFRASTDAKMPLITASWEGEPTTMS